MLLTCVAPIGATYLLFVNYIILGGNMQDGSSNIKVVCVFCSADDKIPQEYKDISYQLGFSLAQNGFSLISGGNNSGLMNSVNDGHAAVENDTVRYAAIPELMRDLSVKHPKIFDHNISWSRDVHHRLVTFQELCDAIVILPGGFGTLHEMMDSLVMSQFGIIKKHIYLFNYDQFWEPILLQFKRMVQKQALCQEHFDHLLVVDTVSELMNKLVSAAEPNIEQGFASEYWKNVNN